MQWILTTGTTIISGTEEVVKGYYGFVFAKPDGYRFNMFYKVYNHAINIYQQCKQTGVWRNQ